MSSVGPVEGGLEHPLGGGVSEPAHARAIARRVLERSAAPQLVIRLAELVASELVTNAVVHGAAPRSMSVTANSRSVTITVQDAAPDSPPIVRHDAPGAGGLGLRFVEAVAESWGCLRVHGAKRVHAVLAMAATPDVSP